MSTTTCTTTLGMKTALPDWCCIWNTAPILIDRNSHTAPCQTCRLHQAEPGSRSGRHMDPTRPISGTFTDNRTCHHILTTSTLLHTCLTTKSGSNLNLPRKVRVTPRSPPSWSVFCVAMTFVCPWRRTKRRSRPDRTRQARTNASRASESWVVPLTLESVLRPWSCPHRSLRRSSRPQMPRGLMPQVLSSPNWSSRVLSSQALMPQVLTSRPHRSLRRSSRPQMPRPLMPRRLMPQVLSSKWCLHRLPCPTPVRL